MTDANTARPATSPVASTRPCLCGCGSLTSGVWAPGHDGRAKGLLRAVARGERTPESLPGQLAAVIGELAQRWSLGTPDENGVVQWADHAKAPTTKRPAASHPATRTLLRAKDQLNDRPDLQELVAECIEALSQPVEG